MHTETHGWELPDRAVARGAQRRSVCLRVHPWTNAATCASVIRGLVPRTQTRLSGERCIERRATAGETVTLGSRDGPATDAAGADCGRGAALCAEPRNTQTTQKSSALTGAARGQGWAGRTRACGAFGVVCVFRGCAKRDLGQGEPGCPRSACLTQGDQASGVRGRMQCVSPLYFPDLHFHTSFQEGC